MDNELFRKKNLSKIISPENIDDFIRVSNPGVWLLLISVVMLLVGMCLWKTFHGRYIFQYCYICTAAHG